MNAPNVGFAAAPLTPAIGGLVTGVDLARPLSDTVIAKLKSAVAERHVLFFEGQITLKLNEVFSRTRGRAKIPAKKTVSADMAYRLCPPLAPRESFSGFLRGSALCSRRHASCLKGTTVPPRRISLQRSAHQDIMRTRSSQNSARA